MNKITALKKEFRGSEGATVLQPATFGSTVRSSNQLSYSPTWGSEILPYFKNSTSLFKDDIRIGVAEAECLFSIPAGIVSKEAISMKTQLMGQIEEALMSEQILGAKVAFCLHEFEKTQDISWFKRAVALAEEGGAGFFAEVSETMQETALEDFLLKR